MSRVAKSPINIPSGVEVKEEGKNIIVKGKLGELKIAVNPAVKIANKDNVISFDIIDTNKKDAKLAWANAGTQRALVNNCIIGVCEGFQKKLTLIGVGYRAQVQGKILNLNLGFSNPVLYNIPEGDTAVNIETPSQTEVIIKGIDKQKVGQVAAEIRSFRPPEPYKGKGIRYEDEYVVRKDAKKK